MPALAHIFLLLTLLLSVATGWGLVEEGNYLEGSIDRETVANASLALDCPPLEVLDFLHFDPQNDTEVQELEEAWPCEVRTYWLSLQGLVSLVRFLFSYVTIGLVIFGLLVNTISLCVLNSPPMNTSSVSVYLRALAVSDIGALVFNVTVGVLRAHSETVSNFYVTHDSMCFLHKILIVVFFYYSTWLVVALTFERFLMIRSPFKAQKWCKLRPSNCMVVIIGCLSLIIALIRTQLTGFEKDNMYGYVPCGSSMKPRWNFAILPFMALTTTVPAILIFVGNVCLLLYIRRSAQDHSNLNASTEEGPNMFRITRMLLVISIAYLVLLLPVGITGITEMYWRTLPQKQPATDKSQRQSYIKWQQQMLLMRWIRGLCFFIFLLNYNINFFLYCISGRKFRETVKTCLQRWLPSFCRCFCLQRKTTISTSTQKRSVLVTTSSITSSHKSDTQRERRILNSSLTSRCAYNNSAFVNNEVDLKIDPPNPNSVPSKFDGL